MSNKLNIFVKFNPLTKADEEQRLVSGYASTEALDSQDEIITLEALQAALPDYMKFANIREMHQAMAAGKAVTATMDKKGLYLVAKVVDENAWAKVKESVYQGFSVGGKTLAKDGNKITKLKLTEISLVDRPANPEATFDTWKADIETETPAILPTAHLPKHIQDMIAKVATDGKLAKGMYTVSSLANAIDTLECIRSNSQWEADAENDGSTIPGRIKALIAELGQVLVDMASEEVSEITAKAAPGGPIQGDPMKVKTAEEIAAAEKLTKAATDKATLTKAIGDLAAAMKVISDAASKMSAPSAELAETHKADMELLASASKELAASVDKLTGVKAPEPKAAAEEGGALTKVLALLTPVTDTMEAINKRLKAIEDTPQPARSLGAGAGVVVEKAEDGLKDPKVVAAAAPKTALEALTKSKKDPIPARAFDGMTNEELDKRRELAKV